jgi:selenocysteine lyase/cysteine desulfurase
VRAEAAERWRPYKARPSPTAPLGRRFETGTPPYELLAGVSATIAYFESLGGMAAPRAHERELARRFVEGLPDGVALYGPPLEERVPTFLLNVDGVPAADAARRLAEDGIGVWHHDHWYSVGLADRLPYEDEAIRVGFIHYNTAEEVDRLLAGLASLVG